MSVFRIPLDSRLRGNDIGVAWGDGIFRRGQDARDTAERVCRLGWWLGRVAGKWLACILDSRFPGCVTITEGDTDDRYGRMRRVLSQGVKIMAYRYGDRYQGLLFPPSVEELVPENAPVRVYDAFVEALDLPKLGFKIDPRQIGCPQYHPTAMLKLLLYGYSYGFRSSRKLERECHYNITFIWLVGGLKPDHKTIAEFRRKNQKALKRVLKQCAQMCLKLEVIEGNTLFVDGTKIRANASIKHTWTLDRCQKALAKVDKRIAEILAQCDSLDAREEGSASLTQLQEELANKQALKDKVKTIVAELEAQEAQKPQTNTTDPDCRTMKSIQGSHASFNMQSVVDEKHGIIVDTDVVNTGDIYQFAEQISQANETLGTDCQTACADAGYSNVEELEKIDSEGIHVVVPSQKQAAKSPTVNPFDKAHFTYDRDHDCYVCPAGQALRYSHTNERDKKRVFRGGTTCRSCEHFGECTKSKAHGRSISRLLKADVQERLAADYETEASQEVYALRKQKVELPFGHFKRNLGVTGFLLRGLEGVKAEAALLASCFNLARMESMLGVASLSAKLAAL